MANKEAIETLRWNIEYIEGRFFKDDGSAADDELKMSIDAMREASAEIKKLLEQMQDFLGCFGQVDGLKYVIDQALAELKAKPSATEIYRGGMSFKEIQNAADEMICETVAPLVNSEELKRVLMLIANLAARMKEKQKDSNR